MKLALTVVFFHAFLSAVITQVGAVRRLRSRHPEIAARLGVVGVFPLSGKGAGKGLRQLLWKEDFGAVEDRTLERWVRVFRQSALISLLAFAILAASTLLA
ncbi:MAG: hypothetical protein K8F56_04605 [Rhodocyclaceae bacterium]|nr:hypothetical protein [Rhodocyclaceae bacterium]